MAFVSAQWADEARQTVIAVTDTGDTVFVPAVEGNADYALITQGRVEDALGPAVPALTIADPE